MCACVRACVRACVCVCVRARALVHCRVKAGAESWEKELRVKDIGFCRLFYYTHNLTSCCFFIIDIHLI